MAKVETSKPTKAKSLWKTNWTIFVIPILIVGGLLSSRNELNKIKIASAMRQTTEETDRRNLHTISERYFDISFNHSLQTQEYPLPLSSSSTPPVHIILALSGNDPGFFLEVEVSLKSILMNAPVKTALTIHILADGPAYLELKKLLHDVQIQQWRSSSPIAIRAYDCSKYISRWRGKVRNLYIHKGKMNDFRFNHSVTFHTIGTWFRLMADDVLPDDVNQALYMDTDVILMANIQELWNHIDDDAYLHWGQDKCAGFVILNIPKLPAMWQVVKNAYETKRDELKSMEVNMLLADQTFLTVFEIEQPDSVVKFPDSWDNHMAHSLWKYKKRLIHERPEIGYIHFNGGAKSKNAWFRDEYGNNTFWVGNRHKYVHDTYGLVDYYIRIPWAWARYFSASNIPNDEMVYNATLEFVVDDGSSVMEDPAYDVEDWGQTSTSNVSSSSRNATRKRKVPTPRRNTSLIPQVHKFKMT